MESTSTRTVEGTEGPRVRQFSIFLENKVGALLELVKLLNERHVEVIGLAVQDTADSAIGRLIVSDPDRAAEVFHENNIPAQSAPVLVAELREAALVAEMLACLLMAEVNIQFIYPLMFRPGGRAALVMRVEDYDCTAAVLLSHGFKVLSQADISR